MIAVIIIATMWTKHVAGKVSASNLTSGAELTQQAQALLRGRYDDHIGQHFWQDGPQVDFKLEFWPRKSQGEPHREQEPPCR